MNIFKKINKNLVSYVISVGILLFVFMFLVLASQIGYEVKNRCGIAQNRYGGECVDALQSQVADNSVQAGKNDAIYALGQLGDKRALPFLESYDNGQPLPDREPWNEGVSQYELRKAIKLLESGYNATAFVWRD